MMRNIRQGVSMPPYMVFPRFLLEGTLSDTAVKVYVLLLDRARLSMTNAEWADEKGDVFLIYTIDELSAALRICKRSISSALNRLEEADLIRRKHRGPQKPNHIYVRIPDSEPVSGCMQVHSHIASTCTPSMHPDARSDGMEMPCNKNYSVKTTQSNEMSKEGRRAYGAYANVLLSEEAYARLGQTYPNLARIIEKMSCYLQSNGRTYRDYEAAIRSWAAREPDSYIMTNYECGEDESL